MLDGIEITIACDKCGDSLWVSGVYPNLQGKHYGWNISDMTEDIESQGWRIVGDDCHYCPECQED